jgi:hypothetical protein
MRRKFSGRSGTTRQPSALAAAMAGIRLTPAPAATSAKMLANWTIEGL